jgi:hypothetical protein
MDSAPVSTASKECAICSAFRATVAADFLNWYEGKALMYAEVGAHFFIKIRSGYRQSRFNSG